MQRILGALAPVMKVPYKTRPLRSLRRLDLSRLRQDQADQILLRQSVQHVAIHGYGRFNSFVTVSSAILANPVSVSSEISGWRRVGQRLVAFSRCQRRMKTPQKCRLKASEAGGRCASVPSECPAAPSWRPHSSGTCSSSSPTSAGDLTPPGRPPILSVWTTCSTVCSITRSAALKPAGACWCSASPLRSSERRGGKQPTDHPWAV